MPSRGLSASTTVVGVIGHPVVHSLSPRLHNIAFAALGLDWVSLGFDVPVGSLSEALTGMRALGIRGLSVTMPHKTSAAALVDRRSALADRLGAINCVANDDGVLSGYSTDGQGLVASLGHDVQFDPAGSRCMVIGAGGAARAVIAALADAGAAEVIVVNRTSQRGMDAASVAGARGRLGERRDATSCDLVVNATPAGMGAVGPAAAPDAGGDPGVWPVDPSLLGPGQVVVDLVYHPPETHWLAAARARGAVVRNGLGMLVHQAALQIELWTGAEAPVGAMWRSMDPDQPG